MASNYSTTNDNVEFSRSLRSSGERGELSDAGQNGRGSISSGARVSRGPVVLDRETYTSGQAAKILGIPSRTMRHYLAKGKIPGKQNPITGTWQVSRENLMQFLLRAGRQVSQLPFTSKILVIDGDPTIEDYLRRALGGEVPDDAIISADTVCEALIQIGLHKPAIVIVHARTPIASGREIVNAIRKTQQIGTVRVLAIGNEDGDGEELESLGGDAVLGKAFTFQDFNEQIHRLIPRLERSALD